MWFLVVLLVAAMSLVVAAKVKKTAPSPKILPLSTYDRDEQVLQMGRPHTLQVIQSRRKAGVLKA
jgi:hypothetical protein